jgi:hypothetical protein
MAQNQPRENAMSNVIGLLAGVIARFLSPGPNEP